MKLFPQETVLEIKTLLLMTDLAYCGYSYICMRRAFGEQYAFFIFVGHNGSPYLPVVNNVDKVLLYFQSVGDSAQGFVNFMGLILLPFLFRRFQ